MYLLPGQLLSPLHPSYPGLQKQFVPRDADGQVPGFSPESD